MAESRRDQEYGPEVRPVPPSGSVAPTARVKERPPATGGRPASTMENGRPRDPAELRREIERTRARMSGTLDALEARVAHEREALERKKEELWAKATLQGTRKKLSREPWRSVAIAFVAGYIVAAILD